MSTPFERVGLSRRSIDTDAHDRERRMTRDYLFEYEPRSGRLEITPFDDSQAALDAYGAAERDHLGDWVTEIVLLGADSIDTLRVTHSHYFASGQPPIIHDLNRPYRRSVVPARA